MGGLQQQYIRYLKTLQKGLSTSSIIRFVVLWIVWIIQAIQPVEAKTTWELKWYLSNKTIFRKFIYCLYRWTWIWRTQWDQENWSVICKIRSIHMTNTWYASDWDQAYRPSYAKIRRTVVRHIQVHLYFENFCFIPRFLWKVWHVE